MKIFFKKRFNKKILYFYLLIIYLNFYFLKNILKKLIKK